MDTLAVIALITVFVCVPLLIMYLRQINMSSNMKDPPCPWRLPLLGNLHKLSGLPHEMFLRLSKKLGPVFCFWFGQTRVVVVNSYTAAKDVLVSKDAFLSGRPQRHIGSLYSNGFKGIIVTDYNKDLINRRKLVHSALQLYGSGFHNLEQAIQEECKVLIGKLKIASEQRIPVDPRSFAPLTVTNIICALLFGSRYHLNDPEFEEIVQINQWIMQGITEAQVIDSFFLLRYLPNKNLALLRNAVQKRDQILEQKLKEHEDTFKEECQRDLTDALLRCLYAGTQNGKVPIDRMVVKMILADVFIAGANTTSEALQWCILYLVTNPDAQRKIQSQIDDAMSNDKSPFASRKSLCPYLMAFIYEVMRIATVSPLGLPHKATKDTTVLGFDIPQNTTVLLNFYAMHMDPMYWPNPNQFKPERFLDDCGNLVETCKSYFPFSSGRRNCLGERLAKTELFLILFYILACFSLEKPNAEYVYDFSVEFNSTTYPKPFKVLFTQRT